MAHGVTPDALAAALERDARRPRRVHRLADLLRHGRRRRGLRRGLPRRGRPARRRPGVGPALRLPPRRCRRARCSRAPTPCSRSTHKIVGSLTQSAMLHVAPTGRIDPDAVGARGAARALDVAVVAADGLARRRAPPARRSTARRCSRARSPPSRPRARGDRRASTAAAWSATSWSAGPGVAGWDPLRIVIDVRGTGCTRLRGRRRAARRPTTSTSSSPRTRRSCSCSASASRAERARALRPRLRARPCARIERPGDAAALVRASGRAASTRSSSPPREAFLGAPEVVAVDDAVGRVSAESIAGYPPGIPALLPGERITAEVVAYLRELRAVGRAPARRERPGLPHDRRALRRLTRRSTDARSTRALAEDVGDGDATTRGDGRRRARARGRRSRRRRPG